MSPLDPTATVAQIVLDHPECARVFRSHRIDFCCHGDTDVAAACAGKRADPATVVRDLERAIAERSPRRPAVDPRALTTPELLQHIVARYHARLREWLPFVEQLARKVARVHGEHNPKLPELADVVAELRASLEPHLDHEEHAIFRLLGRPDADAARLAEEVAAMKTEHLEVGELLARIQTLADRYVVPDWACRSYRTLLSELEALEIDTLEHVHVENHVLAPRFAMPRRARVQEGRVRPA